MRGELDGSNAIIVQTQLERESVFCEMRHELALPHTVLLRADHVVAEQLTQSLHTDGAGAWDEGGRGV